MTSRVPVYVVSFNNATYLRAMVDQLLSRGITTDVRIVDNGSTYMPTITYLREVETAGITVIRRGLNSHPHDVNSLPDLPDEYVLTDPDLWFGDDMPSTVIETLSAIATAYDNGRVGLALDITEPHKLTWDSMKHETDYWKRPIEPKSGITVPLYRAPIDTTFLLRRKGASTCLTFNDIRVAGPFVCKHLPWYLPGHAPAGAPVPSLEELEYYGKHAIYSTHIASVLKVRRLADPLLMFANLHRNGIDFELACEVDCQTNVAFLRHAFAGGWETETYSVLDRFLCAEKTFVDIGAWIGPLAIYAAKKGVARVVCVEADTHALRCLEAATVANACTNVQVIPKALWPTDGWVTMRANTFLAQSMLGDSTSQAVQDGGSSGVRVPCVTLDGLAELGAFDNTCLVKIDIEGGEQHVCIELLRLCHSRAIPLLMAFHVSWWSPTGHKFDDFAAVACVLYPHISLDEVRGNPFASILFV